MSASLPPRPSLEWLRKSARKRLAQLRQTQPVARLADAQLAIAREYGFPSWRRLKAHVESVTERAISEVEDAGAALLRRVALGTIDEVRSMLDAAPALINATARHPFWGGRPQPLHVAIEKGRRDVFELLLERGADVNGSNEEYDDWSPLMLAVRRPALLEELLRRGARVGLAEALMMEDDAQVQTLTRDGALPRNAPNGGSMLAFARTPFAIDRLLSLGVPLDLKDRWGTTPIEAMSRLGPAGALLVHHMIERGAIASPAEYARLGDIAALERIAASDPAAVRSDAAMMAAVDSGMHDVVAWLLEHGASANARAAAPSRHTALHAAAGNGLVIVAKMLVDAGADIRVRDAEHDGTPLDWAEMALDVTGNPECIELAGYLRALEDRDAEVPR